MEQEKSIAVSILSPYGGQDHGVVWIRFWEKKEIKKKAFRKTAKILASVFLVSLLGVFVHLLLPFLVLLLLVTLLMTPMMYFYFSSAQETILYGKGRCPHCKKEQILKPYLSVFLKNTFKLQCSQCGQTACVEKEKISV